MEAIVAAAGLSQRKVEAPIVKPAVVATLAGFGMDDQYALHIYGLIRDVIEKRTKPTAPAADDSSSRLEKVGERLHSWILRSPPVDEKGNPLNLVQVIQLLEEASQKASPTEAAEYKELVRTINGGKVRNFLHPDDQT